MNLRLPLGRSIYSAIFIILSIKLNIRKESIMFFFELSSYFELVSAI